MVNELLRLIEQLVVLLIGVFGATQPPLNPALRAPGPSTVLLGVLAIVVEASLMSHTVLSRYIRYRLRHAINTEGLALRDEALRGEVGPHTVALHKSMDKEHQPHG